MAKFKTLKFAMLSGGANEVVVPVNISVEGAFYAPTKELPDPVIRMLRNNNTVTHSVYRGHNRFEADSFETLKRALGQAVKDGFSPEVSEYQVIRYIIGSSVSYAVNDAGEIRGFAGDGFKWPEKDRQTRDGSKGYRVGLGAVAYTKTVIEYPDGTVRHEYDRYYGKGDHLRHCCPASWLNSWNDTGFDNRGEIWGEKVHEIPYSDDAALFFHDMMHGLCEIAKRLDDFLGAPEKAQQFIANNAGVKLLK